MNLHAYLSTLPQAQRRTLASQAGASYRHLVNASYGYRNCSPALAMAIERISAGAVTRQDLRPHDYHLIWPELAAPSLNHNQGNRHES